MWCGWHNFLGQKSCVTRLSPFGQIHLAVNHDLSPSKLQHLSQAAALLCPSPFCKPSQVLCQANSNNAGKLCKVEVDEHISLLMIAQTLAGAFLFLNASRLSASVFFRLGTGSAGVMLLSVLILLFLISRSLHPLFARLKRLSQHRRPLHV